MSTIRLDKYLADAGIGTRSQVKSYIKKGLVMVNSTVASTPDLKINTDKDVITFQGNTVSISEFEYYILNKPSGYVSATKDNVSPTVLSLVDSTRHDLFPVGRLDKDTEGLLLITNDGSLSHRLVSPKHHVEKTYYAVVEGNISENDVAAFAHGLHIGDEDLTTTLPARLVVLSNPGVHYPDNFLSDNVPTHNLSYVYVTITEGKFHQVKRMFRHIGSKVIYLKRISFGGVALPDDLDIGQSRKLTEDELALLMQ